MSKTDSFWGKFCSCFNSANLNEGHTASSKQDAPPAQPSPQQQKKLQGGQTPASLQNIKQDLAIHTGRNRPGSGTASERNRPASGTASEREFNKDAARKGHASQHASHGADSGLLQQFCDHMMTPQDIAAKLSPLLQELTVAVTNSYQTPMARLMSLLSKSLSLSWVSISAVSSSGNYYQVLGSSFSPEVGKGGLRFVSFDGQQSGSSSTQPPIRRPPSRTSSASSVNTMPNANVEVGCADAVKMLGTASSIEQVCGTRKPVMVVSDNDTPLPVVPTDWIPLCDRGLRSLLCLPVYSATANDVIVGTLSFGTVDPCGWDTQWWMPSLKLLTSWAATALVQTKALARVDFFDALLSSRDLAAFARAVVKRLPYLFTDQGSNRVECRLALVTTSVKHAVIHAPAYETTEKYEALANTEVVEDALTKTLLSSLSIGEDSSLASKELVCYPIAVERTLLSNVIESGEILIIKDSLAYFGRGHLRAADLMLPNRLPIQGALVMLPLVYRCRPLGCVYVCASYDVNSTTVKQAWTELAELLSRCSFHKLVYDLLDTWSEHLAQVEACLTNSQAMILTSSQQQGAGSSPVASSSVIQFSSQLTAAMSSPDVAPQYGPADLEADGDPPGPKGKVVAARLSRILDDASGSVYAGNSEPLPSKLVAGLRNMDVKADVLSWPELLLVTTAINRTRHSALYTAKLVGETVAVKVLRFTMSNDGRQGQASEQEQSSSQLQRLAHVQHPHLVYLHTVYPYIYEVVSKQGTDIPTVFFTSMLPRREMFKKCVALVLEYCPGLTLREALAKGLLAASASPGSTVSPVAISGTVESSSGDSPPSVPQLVSLAPTARRLSTLCKFLLQIAQGMQKLHSLGIIHGELRPENVLCCIPKGKELANLTSPVDIPIDACSVKIKDAGLCVVTTVKGQLIVRKLVNRPRSNLIAFLAPEVFCGEQMSKVGDVYMFGLLMWELYTGQMAFESLSTTPTKLLQMVISDGIRPTFPESTPSWYSTLATKCWLPNAKQRPSFNRIVKYMQSVSEEENMKPVEAA